MYKKLMCFIVIDCMQLYPANTRDMWDVGNDKGMFHYFCPAKLAASQLTAESRCELFHVIYGLIDIYRFLFDTFILPFPTRQTEKRFPECDPSWPSFEENIYVDLSKCRQGYGV